ncbi:MAG: tRNA pseudouridine(55) synthase TruB, partial [Actinomycetota bacterium]
ANAGTGAVEKSGDGSNVKVVSIPPCAVLLVDKPAGITSHDVVDRIRRLTGIRKVGHAGTLDPFATGLLLVLVGKATRLSDYFTPLDKEYRVTVQFGAASTTGDVDGVITPAAPPTPVTEEALRETLPGFTGKMRQRAHAYSAVKVGGEALYRKARRGETVKAPVRDIEVHRLELESFDGEKQQAVLSVACSKGTYIRQLCEDIAAALGTAAYAAILRRTRVGEFRVDRAAGLEKLGSMPRESLLTESNPSFITALGALYFLPVRDVDEKDARAVTAGRAISGEESGPVRLAADGRLLAIYRPGDDPGQLRPLVVLA